MTIAVPLCLGANVHATTATGDTALTYACENGHTDVADVLLQTGADLVSAFLFCFPYPHCVVMSLTLTLLAFHYCIGT